MTWWEWAKESPYLSFFLLYCILQTLSVAFKAVGGKYSRKKCQCRRKDDHCSNCEERKTP